VQASAPSSRPGDPAAGREQGGANPARARPGRTLRRPSGWLAGRTLRGRLIAGLLVLLALACAAVGSVTYVHLHTVLVGQLNQELSDASLRYIGCITHVLPPEAGESSRAGSAGAASQLGNPPAQLAISVEECAQQQAGGAFSAALSGGAVRYPYLASASGRTDGITCRLTAADLAQLTRLPLNGQPRTVRLASYGSYQVLAARPADGGRAYFSGLSLAGIDLTLRDVAVEELAVFAIVLLLAGAMGTGWVRLSLRPLRRVAATAASVTELPLGTGAVTLPDRVPDADSGTEVGQVGAAFNRMLGHVEAALGRRAASEARLRRFAADASHELRTPLAVIRGYAELARRDPGPVPDTVAHALRRVESESARMSVLVDELLLLAQLDAGRPLAAVPVDLTRLAIDAASDARVAAPDHRWVLELPDEPVLVRGDDHRLQQVLANLLSNAAKHTPAGTTVTVGLAVPGGTDGSSGAGDADSDRPQVTRNPAGPAESPAIVQVTVTDDGPGIPAGLQPTLFERFVRGDGSRSPGAGSTGLGLAIVDAVTTAHHGQVELASKPGRTRFTISLPQLAGAEAEAASQHAARS